MQLSPLGLNQLQAAKYEYLSPHICDWRENPRPFSTIAVMQKGSGRFVVANETVEVSSGQVFFIPAGTKYISYWTGTNTVLYFAIHFHFDNWFSEYAPQRFSLQKAAAVQPDTIINQLEKIRRYVSGDGIEQLKALSAFYELYADILPTLEHVKARLPASESIKRAIDFIEQNSDQDFTVKDLALLCHLSESRLYTLFQQSVGYSPIAYRNSVRIRKAMTLLGGDYTIDEVAVKVGFDSAVYFRRVFKDIMGKLPSEFKKQLQFEYA